MCTKVMATTILAVALFSLMPRCICDDAPKTDSATVLNRHTEKTVDEIVVHARFLTGTELNDLQKLIGVPAEILDQESAASAREHFLVVKVTEFRFSKTAVSEICS